jgi:hypothetical protein
MTDRQVQPDANDPATAGKLELEAAASAAIAPDESPDDSPAASGLRRWILEHDESWLFVGVYITLAVVLSIWISLFWLVVVVAGHFALEFVRHRHVDPWPPGVIVRALWEIKLDIGLVLFALVIGIYMEFILGIAGLSSAARAGLQSGARFAGWQRAIRGVLLSVDDAAQLGRAVVRSENNVNDSEADESTLSHRGLWGRRGRWGGWTARWSLGDRLSISLSIISITLILLAPLLADQTFAETWSIILEELHPYPVD